MSDQLFDTSPDSALDLIERDGEAAPEKKWAPLLADLVRVLEAVNLRAGATPESAFDAAKTHVMAIAEYIGGRMIYLPRGDRLITALKHAEIWRRFSGNNVPELAAEFGMSEIHVYAILRKQRALHQRKLQGRLFD